MVKTRAQRREGLMTPSPKILSQTGKECSPNGDTARKVRHGTKGKGKRATLTNEVEQTPKCKSARGKTSPRTQRGINVSVRSEKKLDPVRDLCEEAGQVDTREEEKLLENVAEKKLVEDISTEDGQKKYRGKQSTVEDVEDLRSNRHRGGSLEGDETVEEKTRRVKERRGRQKDVLVDEAVMGQAEEEEEKEEEQTEEQEGEEEDDEIDEKEQESEGKDTIHLNTGRLPSAMEDEEQSDSPEDVSFARSRQEALESISQALQQSRRSEEVAKEKRRKRDKLLKLQKERKKISLQHSKLPEDFLSEVAELASQKQEVTFAPNVTSQSQPTKPRQHKVFDLDEEEDVIDRVDDYIPFSPDEPHIVEGFEVHAVSRQKRAPPPKSESALDFLQKQLYGSKVKRESVNKHQSRLLKRKGQPAMIFLNKKEKKRKR